MSYNVKQLADLAGVSVRTLHYYDQIGLLKPVRNSVNGYRVYGKNELMKLQQILFFRELDFPLSAIKKILLSPDFDMEQALRDQKKLIFLKKDRLTKIIKTIDKTILKLNDQLTMKDKDLYDSLSDEQIRKYSEEAKQRWGNTEAYRQSVARVKKLGKEGMKKVMEEGNKLMVEIASNMDKKPESEVIQKLIERHYNNLKNFYDPNPRLYRGLAEMYIADERFTAYYEKFRKGLAQFMHEAMIYFAENKKN